MTSFPWYNWRNSYKRVLLQKIILFLSTYFLKIFSVVWTLHNMSRKISVEIRDRKFLSSSFLFQNFRKTWLKYPLFYLALQEISFLCYYFQFFFSFSFPFIYFYIFSCFISQLILLVLCNNFFSKLITSTARNWNWTCVFISFQLTILFQFRTYESNSNYLIVSRFTCS